MDIKEDMLEPDHTPICTWIICWWTPLSLLWFKTRSNTSLCSGSTRVRLARSVVGVTSRALAVSLPDIRLLNLDLK